MSSGRDGRKFRQAVRQNLSLEEVKSRYYDVNKQYNKPYNHPIHHAAYYNHPEIISFLVTQLDCDVDMKNCDEHTPLEIAIRECNFHAFDTLLNLGACQHIPIRPTIIDKIITDNHINMLESLIFHQIIDVKFIESYDIFSQTDISISMLKIFVALGFDVNNQNNRNGSTPLMISAKCPGRFDKIKILLAAGADTSRVDNRGRTVFDYLDNPYTETYFANFPLTRQAVLKLLTEGVSKEYQQEFDEEMEDIRCRLDKRNVYLLTLLRKQLGI